MSYWCVLQKCAGNALQWYTSFTSHASALFLHIKYVKTPFIIPYNSQWDAQCILSLTTGGAVPANTVNYNFCLQNFFLCMISLYILSSSFRKILTAKCNLYFINVQCNLCLWIFIYNIAAVFCSNSRFSLSNQMVLKNMNNVWNNVFS